MTTDCIIVLCVLGVFQLLDILHLRQIKNILDSKKDK